MQGFNISVEPLKTERDLFSFNDPEILTAQSIKINSAQPDLPRPFSLWKGTVWTG